MRGRASPGALQEWSCCGMLGLHEASFVKHADPCPVSLLCASSLRDRCALICLHLHSQSCALLSGLIVRALAYPVSCVSCVWVL